MSQFVLNEWFWADLRGDNGQNKRAETFQFLQRLAASEHQIVVTLGTAFDTKAWNLCVSAPEFGRAFVLLLRQDSERCLILHESVLRELPASIELKVKPDDRYLVQTCLAVPGATLVTTDTPLAEAVKEAGINCISREEALQSVQKSGPTPLTS